MKWMLLVEEFFWIFRAYELQIEGLEANHKKEGNSRIVMFSTLLTSHNSEITHSPLLAVTAQQLVFARLVESKEGCKTLTPPIPYYGK